MIQIKLDDVNWGEIARLHSRFVRQGQKTNPYFTRTGGRSCYRYYGALGSKRVNDQGNTAPIGRWEVEGNGWYPC